MYKILHIPTAKYIAGCDTTAVNRAEEVIASIVCISENYNDDDIHAYAFSCMLPDNASKSFRRVYKHEFEIVEVDGV